MNHHAVIASATVQLVCTTGTHQGVVAVAAEQQVRGRASLDEVAAAVAVDDVRRIAAVDHVITGGHRVIVANQDVCACQLDQLGGVKRGIQGKSQHLFGLDNAVSRHQNADW